MGKKVLVIVIILGLCVVGFYSYKKGADVLYGDFNSNKKAEAQRLYNDVMSLQDNTNYPKTPEEVIQFYNKGYKLIYGDMVNNDDIILDILHQQRKLYTDELLNTTTLEQQKETLDSALELLEDNKYYVIALEAKPAIYDKGNSDYCYVRVIIMGNDFSESTYHYYLEKDNNDLWKIQGWKAIQE